MFGPPERQFLDQCITLKNSFPVKLKYLYVHIPPCGCFNFVVRGVGVDSMNMYGIYTEI